ncbi:hypothetical protein ANOM_000316 [Aspergillus nomiae NRRL 13137]|uniref:NAD dependent epimerase/dehydratase n=1 Tax=Aspergillus nomiae NRRL (strain ATCC 15546 / NRRL 13137 / CBS 260.88 / M93) TaxID=1509407 RepID=A0A0L1JHK2_ASPN3|nr:uncharacterized protein ANOM_000316 [Aspergillus nomiae NRRL 13137]KNG91244.1 hypothetical protein ANOM_000316 [Aspergillus nomiae NRRL 13137]
MHFYEPTLPIIPRPKPMRVLILGLPRTGTTSLYAALKSLGFNTYHYNEIVKHKNNQHFQLWLEALQAKYDGIGTPFKGEDFDRMLWNYDAASADPCCFFVQEMIAAYPDAKVILTTRPRDAWLRSMQTFLLEILSWKSWPVLGFFDDEFSGPYYRFLSQTMSILSKGLVPYSPSAQPTILKSFDDHNDFVRRTVPKERLLEFHPSDGWGPLCEFLDLPAPKQDFPYLNSAQDAMKQEQAQYWSRWSWVAKRLSKRCGLVLLAFIVVKGLAIS